MITQKTSFISRLVRAHGQVRIRFAPNDDGDLSVLVIVGDLLRSESLLIDTNDDSALSSALNSALDAVLTETERK